MNDGLSAADVMALTNNRSDPAVTAALMDRDENNLWQNPFIYLVWIWAFSMFGNGGWGGFGNNGAGQAALQGALTRADLCEEFNFNNLDNSVRSIQNGLCDGFYAMNNSLKDGFYGTQATVKDGFYATQTGLAENRFAQQNCCCETNRNIDSVRTENYKNTCEIVNAIRSDGDATRALINANTMQDLRDKLADRDRDLQTANFHLSQQAQNATLIDALRPFPKPSYITCSPYTSNVGTGCCGNVSY